MILKTAANYNDEGGYIEAGKEGGYYEVGGQRTEIGGGGSSDFSTAKVTFVNNSNYTVTINCAHIDDVDGLLATTDLGVNHSLSLDGVLYKNAGTLAVYTSNDDPLTLAVEGNATVDGQFGAYTGDCTITITKTA